MTPIPSMPVTPLQTSFHTTTHASNTTSRHPAASPNHRTQIGANPSLNLMHPPTPTTHLNPYHRPDTPRQRPPRLTQSTLDSSSPPLPTDTQPIQTTLYPDETNNHWGDPVNMEPPPHYLCVLSRNVNTINPAENFLQWRAAAQALHAYSVGVACLQETNTQWSNPILHRVRQIMAQLPTKHAKVATSSSAEVILGNYQPGGTSTIALGRWVPRARLADQDPHGLGRWSYIEFKGGDGRRIVIVSVYRSCSQQTRLGSGTYHDQQYRLLLSEHNP